MTLASCCTIISCFNGMPSVLCRENAMKLSYLPYLASRRAELVQSVLPPCCAWFCCKDHWSRPWFCWKASIPFLFQGDLCLWATVDLKQQESPSLLLVSGISFRHILNPVLCILLFFGLWQRWPNCASLILWTQLFAHIIEAYNKI